MDGGRGTMRLVAMLIAFAGVNGAIAVAVGAAAAHVAEPNWGPRAGELLRTGSDYQMWHALALLGVAAWLPRVGGWARRLAAIAGAGFALGICGFSLSLYWAALGGRAALAPVGGMLLIASWLVFAASGGVHWLRRAHSDEPRG